MQYKMSHPDLAGIGVNHFDLVYQEQLLQEKNPLL